MDGLSTTVTCPECGHEFAVAGAGNTNGFAEVEYATYKYSGKRYDLVSCECPGCRRRVFVQADDARTRGILKSATSVVYQARRSDAKKKRVLSEKYRVYVTQLREERGKLMRLLGGKTVKDEQGNGVEVVFSA